MLFLQVVSKKELWKRVGGKTSSGFQGNALQVDLSIQHGIAVSDLPAGGNSLEDEVGVDEACQVQAEAMPSIDQLVSVSKERDVPRPNTIPQTSAGLLVAGMYYPYAQTASELRQRRQKLGGEAHIRYPSTSTSPPAVR